MDKKVIEVKDMKMHFEVKGKTIKAVDGISFDIYEGETLGLVGESGSGKSTTGRALIQLYELTSGEIKINGELLISKKEKKSKATKNTKLKKELPTKMQMIFQDPFASVNPRLSAGEIISEGLKLHHKDMSKKERNDKVVQLLETVGMNAVHSTRYPHEFSGGQLQRIGIARTLAVEPKIIIADEAISALDVSIQAQVVNLMKKLQDEFGLTYLFIAHDLSMVQYISDRIAVMHKGKIVELASKKELYENPLHPYTKSLISAIPNPDPISEKVRKRIIYDSNSHDYETDKPKMNKINDDHFVYCNEKELKALI